MSQLCVYVCLCVNTYLYAWGVGMILKVDYLNFELCRIYFWDEAFKILKIVAEYSSTKSIILCFYPQSIRLRGFISSSMKNLKTTCYVNEFK